MTDFFSHPDDFGEIQQSELHASLGESLGAQAKDSLDPKNSLSGMYILRRMREENAGGGNIGVPGAGGELDVFSGQPIEERQAASDAFRAAVPETSIADAKSRVKQEGLEQHLKLPEQPSIKSPVLDLMISEAHERRDREIAIARGPQGFVPGALGVVTSIGAGMIDPVNAAAFSVPVLGEARMGKLLASAGDSIINRAGVRALEGGVQGAAGTALLQPADWWLHTQDGQDYTFADALKSIALGAGMGATFHAGIGGFGDVRARMRGDVLPGSPADILQHGLTAPHIQGEALASDGMTADEVAASIEQLLGTSRRPAHPAEVLRDLPPAAREDAVRSAVADIIADRPVRAGEMLEIAGEHDPRIAESLDIVSADEGPAAPATKNSGDIRQNPADIDATPKPRGRGAAHPDTLSLNEHLSSRGGLRPDPELEAIYGNKRGPFVPGFGPLIRKTGMSLDDALSSAKQHGYMSDPHDADNGTAGTGGRTSHGLTPNDLLDHLDTENRGQKLYKAGHLEATKYDAAQEKHVFMGALETELEKSGADVSAIDPKLLDRTVEIVHREGVSDVLDAYERAIMEDEERYNAIADARRSDPAVADLPGFDDRGAAPGNGGRDQGGDRQAGRPEQGRGRADDSQPSSHGARSAAAAADPRWRELGDVKPAYDDPQAVAESQAADAVTEPASVTPKAITAIERAATEAEEAWRQVEDSYTDKEKALVNDALATIDAERKETDDLIKEGAACLAAAEAV